MIGPGFKFRLNKFIVVFVLSFLIFDLITDAYNEKQKLCLKELRDLSILLPSPDLSRHISSPPSLTFPYVRPTKAYAARIQTFKSEEELNTFLKYGFTSFARRNLTLSSVKRVEDQVAQSREWFSTIATAQKYSYGEIKGPKDFAAPLIEATTELGYFALATSRVELRITIHKEFAVVIAKISTSRGVPLTNFRSLESEQEGGIMFLGNIPPEDIPEMILIRNQDGKLKWIRLVRSGTKWNETSVDEAYYKQFVAETLKSSEHPSNVNNYLRLIQSEGWPQVIEK